MIHKELILSHKSFYLSLMYINVQLFAIEWQQMQKSENHNVLLNFVYKTIAKIKFVLLLTN